MSNDNNITENCFSFLKHIGCSVQQSDTDAAILIITIQPYHLQHMGYVHGGVISTLADNTGWFVLSPFLKEGETAVTQELTINYLRPGKGKELRCIGKLIKKGKHSAFVTTEVFCDDTLIATSSSHLCILSNATKTPVLDDTEQSHT